MVVSGLGLLASLFLPWSHQLSASVIAQYGASAALEGVPRNPDAWQLYSAVDVLFALLAAGVMAAALRGGRPSRLILLAGLLIGAAFTVHALGTPPTNGVQLYDPSLTPPGYTPTSPTAGPGETLALAGLGVGLAGVLLSFTAD